MVYYVLYSAGPNCTFHKEDFSRILYTLVIGFCFVVHLAKESMDVVNMSIFTMHGHSGSYHGFPWFPNHGFCKIPFQKTFEGSCKIKELN